MWECGLKHTRPGSNNARPEVTPYVGVWIETSYNSLILSYDLKSLLMWECGLKLAEMWYGRTGLCVTPYVGVWIETLIFGILRLIVVVTPYVGVWIET